MFEFAALIFYNVCMIYKPKMKQKIKDNNTFSLCDTFLENWPANSKMLMIRMNTFASLAIKCKQNDT